MTMTKHQPCVDCGLPWNAATSYECMGRHCKECWKVRVKLRRLKMPAGQTTIQRERRKLPHNRARAVKSAAVWYAKNREKGRAYKAVAYAVRTYNLTRGCCEKCRTDENVCGFHTDFAQPLKVTWRCRRCHGAAQRADRLAHATALAIPINARRMNEQDNDQ